MYFITYLDRVNVSTAAVVFSKELNLSNTQLGIIFSAFAYPYLAFQIIGGWIGDKFGPKRTLAICAVIWAGATILTGLAGGFVSMILARVLLGFGEGATFPVATCAMARWVPAQKRGFAQGITHSASRLGSAAAPAVVAGLISLYSWRASFFIVGVLSFSWVLLWLYYFKDDPASHPHITAEELTVLPYRDVNAPRPAIPWGQLFKRILPVSVVYFCYGWALWLFLSWIPSYFKHSYNLDLKHSALFSSGVFLAGMVGDTLGGLISDQLLKKDGQPARRALGDDSVLPVRHPAGAGADDVLPRPSYFNALFDVRRVFPRIDHWTDLGRTDGYRPEVCRNGERHHELRFGFGRNYFPGGRRHYY